MNYPDLFNVQFWWIVVLALIVLVPLRHGGGKWALAGINLSLFVLMLKSRTAAVLALVILAWIALNSG